MRTYKHSLVIAFTRVTEWMRTSLGHTWQWKDEKQFSYDGKTYSLFKAVVDLHCQLSYGLLEINLVSKAFSDAQNVRICVFQVTVAECFCNYIVVCIHISTIMSGQARRTGSIYASLYVKGSHRAKRTPRVARPWRPKVIAWAGPNAFVRNRSGNSHSTKQFFVPFFLTFIWFWIRLDY